MKLKQFNMMGMLLKSVFALAALVVASGCGDDDVKPTTPKEETTFTLGTINQFDTSFSRFGISEALFNKDQTVAYVKDGNGEIYRANLKSGLKGVTAGSWQKLALTDPAKTNNVGQAQLLREQNKANRKLFLGEKGLIVLTEIRVAGGAGAADTAALAYFEGDALVPTHAWTSEAAHVAGGALTQNMPWVEAASVVKDDGKELIVVANSGLAFGAVGVPAVEVSSVEVGANQFTGQHIKATVFANAPKIVAAEKGKDAIYFVSDSGVAILEKSKLNAVGNAIADEAADAASDKWEFVAGQQNRFLKQVLLHKGKLYIALNEYFANTGGIAVYDIDAKTTVKPDASWNLREVNNLFVGGDNVKAIFANALYDVKDNGVLGEMTFSLLDAAANKFSGKMLALGDEISKKTLYRTIAFPRNISRAYAFGKDLLIGDGNNLFTITYADRTISQAKAEEGTTTPQQ